MRVSQTTSLAVVAATLSFQSTTSFAPPLRSDLVASTGRKPRQWSRAIGDPAVSYPHLSAGPPVISNWRYEPSQGTISGTVVNHPIIPDGNRITTSPVKDPVGVNEGRIVQTKSGSRYKLSGVAFGARIPAVEAKRAKEKERLEAEKREKAKAAAAKKTTAAARKLAPQKARRKMSPGPSVVVAPSKAKEAKVTEVSPSQLRKLAKLAFSLTGTTVGTGGKYLLSGRPRQSSGRAAKIWTAYLANPDLPGIPIAFDGNASSKVKPLTVKLSPDLERIRLENSNYNKVQSGLFSGRFVKKIDYVEYVPSSDRRLDGRVSLLAIESGQYDLKALLAERAGQPLRGRALRDAAASAGQCIQAVHSSGLVWTDLKTENFVVVNEDGFRREVGDVDGSMGLPGVKGIDLESVMACRGNPIDYSPEACPPEFARALMSGAGEAFVLDYSYDIWSLGMMLYELSTGKAYFEKKSPIVVTKLLCEGTFEADVSEVPDSKLRDLIGKCLSTEPGKRPDITGFLLHPYFITTGFGPISF